MCFFTFFPEVLLIEYDKSGLLIQKNKNNGNEQDKPKMIVKNHLIDLRIMIDIP